MKELTSSKAAGLWLKEFLTKCSRLTGAVINMNASLWLLLEISSSQTEVKKGNLKTNEKKKENQQGHK